MALKLIFLMLISVNILISQNYPISNYNDLSYSQKLDSIKDKFKLYRKLGDVEKSIEKHHILIKLCKDKSLGKGVIIGKLSLLKKLVYSYKPYDSVYPIIEEIEENYIDSMKIDEIIDLYELRSASLLDNFNYEGALQATYEMEQALDEYNQGRRYGYAELYALKSVIRSRLRDYEKSIHFSKKAINEAVNEEEVDSAHVGFLYEGLSFEYLNKGMIDSAIVQINSALNYAPFKNNIPLLITKASYLGDTKRYNQASLLYKKIRKRIRSLDAFSSGTIFLKRDFFKNYGYLNFQLKNYDSASFYLDSALYYIDSNDLKGKKAVLGVLIAAKLQDDSDLIDYYDSLYALEINQQLIESTVELETKYELSKKQNTINKYKIHFIADKYIHKNQQLTYLAYFLVLVLILILAAFYFFYSKFKTNKKMNEMKAKSLRLQINPHFFFNVLNSISSYIGKRKPIEAQKYLSKLSKLMRYSLESVYETTVYIEEEIKFAESYLKVQQIENPYFDFTVHVDEEFSILLKDKTIPSMILQPYLENSILHGLKNIDEKNRGLIELVVSVEDRKNVLILIKDNGIGLNNKDSNTNKKSLALSINENRLYMFSKQSEVTIRNRNDSNGVVVTIRFPLI